MTNKLCDLEKTMWKMTKIGNTPLLYIKEKNAPEFGQKTHNTIRVFKGNLPTGFPFLYS